MASLMEDLLDTLEKENAEYEKLLDLSMKKTPVIVSADLEQLQQITDDEQEIVSSINRLDKVREDCMRQIAGVINKDVKELTLGMVVDIFKKRPAEHKKLADVYDNMEKYTIQSTVLDNHKKGEDKDNPLTNFGCCLCIIVIFIVFLIVLL